MKKLILAATAALALFASCEQKTVEVETLNYMQDSIALTSSDFCM